MSEFGIAFYSRPTLLSLPIYLTVTSLDDWYPSSFENESPTCKPELYVTPSNLAENILGRRDLTIIKVIF
jgi:hypothetical protein